MKDKEKSFREKLVSEMKRFFEQKVTHHHIDLVFLYGSWATGYPHQDSDIDLAVLLSPEVRKQGEIFILINEISYKLGEKLNKEVNIISISRDFNHPMLYYNAIILGIPVFVKDYDELLNLKLEAISQLEDFQLFGISWQREVARRILLGDSHA